MTIHVLFWQQKSTRQPRFLRFWFVGPEIALPIVRDRIFAVVTRLHKSPQNEKESSMKQSELSMVKRLLLCSLVPNIVFYLALCLVLYSVHDQLIDLLPIDVDQPAAGGTHPVFIFFILGVVGFAGIVVGGIMLVATFAFSTAAAFIRWQHWYSALLGGLFAVSMGCAFTVALMFALKHSLQ